MVYVVKTCHSYLVTLECHLRLSTLLSWSQLWSPCTTLRKVYFPPSSYLSFYNPLSTINLQVSGQCQPHSQLAAVHFEIFQRPALHSALETRARHSSFLFYFYFILFISYFLELCFPVPPTTEVEKTPIIHAVAAMLGCPNSRLRSASHS